MDIELSQDAPTATNLRQANATIKAQWCILQSVSKQVDKLIAENKVLRAELNKINEKKRPAVKTLRFLRLTIRTQKTNPLYGVMRCVKRKAENVADNRGIENMKESYYHQRKLIRLFPVMPNHIVPVVEKPRQAKHFVGIKNLNFRS